MRTGDLERQFGVSRQTIYNWIERFSPFFSPVARGENTKQRMFDSNDYLVLATVSELSREGFGYDAIGQRLEEGYRVHDPASVTIEYSDGRMIPAAAVEQIIDASEIKAALAQVTSERDHLLNLLSEEKQGHQEARVKVQDLQEEIAKLQRELGRAEGELEYRRALDKRDD